MAYAQDQEPLSVAALREASRHARDFDAVPIIDFSAMVAGDAAAKSRMAAELRDACARVGFFYLTHHGVAPGLTDAAFAAARAFFAAEATVKLACDVAGSAHACGYVPLLAEDGDLHEAFDCAAEDRIIDGVPWRGDFRQASNRWPADMPAFRRTLTAYSDAMRRLARQIYAALAVALGLPEDHFAPDTDHPLSLLRILHYPSQDEATAGMIGAGAHTDHECFTILCPDHVQALQVRNGAGEWLFVPQLPGAFVINIGDQMSRWTNDRFVSTMHRVVNLSGFERYSIPFFVGPNHDARIAALPSCVSPDHPARYAPFVAGDYAMANILSSFDRSAAPSGITTG